MEIDKNGVKWYTRKELMELLKTAERVSLDEFNAYSTREKKFMLAKFCKEENESNGCDDCLLLDECQNLPCWYKDTVVETLVDWLLLQDTYDKEGIELVEKMFDKRMKERVL